MLWKVEEALRDAGNPVSMKAQHNSNIFCLGSDSSNAKIFSAGNDERVIVHDLKTYVIVVNNNFIFRDNFIITI